MRNRRRHARRTGRSYWGVVIFLVGFFALLALVCIRFLLPASKAATSPLVTPQEKHALAAYSWLLMVLMLIALLCGLILTFHVGRFFFPGPNRKKSRTAYIDAWAESAKRMQTPKKEDQQE